MLLAEKRYLRMSFFTALLMGMLLFVPFIAMDRGIFVYYGDYNAQQIPFYIMGHDAVKSGNIFWNWATDIGVNFIGSYSFYMLGSPFFWLTLLFPPSFVPYLMGPLLIIKIALSSLFAYIYIRRFVKSPEFAVIGGLLYAFSGFSIYNIFFNHFHEPMLLFPLILIAIEETVINKRRGFFAAVVFFTAVNSYFFLASTGVFVFIYFIVRCLSEDFKKSIKAADITALFFEGVIGIAMAAVILLPSLYAVLDVPRTDNLISGWDMVFYDNVQRYGVIIKNFFYPPDIPARQVFFPDSEAKWASVAAYLPLFSMSGAVAFIRHAKKHFVKKLAFVLMLCIIIPALNSMFMLFNNTFYTRWYYIPVLFLCFMTAYSLDNSGYDMMYGVKVCGFFVGLFSLIGFLPKMVKVTEKTSDDSLPETSAEQLVFGGLPSNTLYFWLSVFIAAVSLLALIWLLTQRKYQDKYTFAATAFKMTVAFCIISALFTMVYGRILGPYAGEYEKSVNADINIEDDEFFRIEAPSEIHNIGMVWGYNSFSSFHSIIPKSTFDLYKELGENRSVNSKIDYGNYALRSLLGVKYLVVKSDRREDLFDNPDEPVSGFEFLETQGEYDIFVNKNAVSMGVAYDFYCDDIQVNATIKTVKDRLMVKAVYLSEEQAERYKDILEPLPNGNRIQNTYETFVSDAKTLKSNAVDSFEIYKNGFTAATSFETDRFVFFAVPYDKGWSAEVNGTAAMVEKVNVGFIGIRVPAGQSSISFTYMPTGLTEGLYISVVSAGVFLIYIVIMIILSKCTVKFRVGKHEHLIYNFKDIPVKAHLAYINLTYEKIYNENDVTDQKHSSEIKWPDIREDYHDKKLTVKEYDKETVKKITDEKVGQIIEELDKKNNK